VTGLTEWQLHYLKVCTVTEYRSDNLTKTLDNSTLILNFKVFCEANKQDTKLEIV